MQSRLDTGNGVGWVARGVLEVLISGLEHGLADHSNEVDSLPNIC